MPDCEFESAEWFKKELGLAIGGATLFIVVSKISLLLNLLHKKSWYTDLMTFLVALSMGTMYCVTLAQFIPEAFGLHTEYKYKVKDACTIVKLGEYIDLFDKMPPFMKTDCEEKCENSLRKSETECSLTIGGPKVYIWIAMVAYIATIISYSSEHVVNFITWTRTSRKNAENESRGEITEDQAFHRKANRARTMQIAAQMNGIPSSNIVQSYSQCIRRTHSMEIYSTVDNLKKQSGSENLPAIPPRRNNRESYETATYWGNNIVIESNSTAPIIPKENRDSDSDDHHGKQDWSKVQTHAWTLLLTIAIKSFIEGIAFVLTLQDSFSAGLAFLVAMIFKLFPLEPGYAIILSDAGLNHFWENLLSTLAVLPIFIGAILGIILEDEFNAVKGYIFAALSGIFLYLSLSTLFPVLKSHVRVNTISNNGVSETRTVETYVSSGRFSPGYGNHHSTSLFQK